MPQRQHGHRITGVILTPTPTKPLAGMVINKPSDGHYLVFWGAVGTVTSPVDADASRMEDSGDGADATIAQSRPSIGTSGSAMSGTTRNAGAASGTTPESGSTGTGMATSGAVASGAGGNGSGTVPSGSGGVPAGAGARSRARRLVGGRQTPGDGP